MKRLLLCLFQHGDEWIIRKDRNDTRCECDDVRIEIFSCSERDEWKRREYGIVSGCRFSDCNATEYDGGGIRDISFSAVRSCYIHSCHASRYHGGSIHWRYPTNEQVSLSEWILVFELNSANSTGHDVSIESDSYNRTESIFDGSIYVDSSLIFIIVWSIE